MEANNNTNKPQYGVGDARAYRSPQPNKALALVIYLLTMTLGISLIIMGLIALRTTSEEYSTAIEIIGVNDAITIQEYNIDLVHKAKLLYGIGCFIGYLLMAVGVVWFMRDELYKDLEKIKKNKKFYLLYIPLCAIGFIAVIYTFTYFWGMITTDSDNQASIVSIIEYGGVGGILLMISTVLFAPIVEEFIYRKLPFATLGKWSKVSAYIVAILAFALIHMISSNMKFDLNWFLNLISYLVCSAGLTVIFERGKENIIASIAAHSLNNIVACILVLISMK